MFRAVRDVTVGHLITRLAEQLPEQPALVSGDRRWTFQELESDSRHLAAALRSWGVTKGQRVAVWSTNLPEWVLLQFALAKIGAILVTVNTSLRAAEVGYLLNNCGASAVFTIRGFREVDYLAELRDCGWKGPIVVLDEVAPPGLLRWSELWSLGDGRELGEIPIGLDDCVNMQYTSGTTGFPKGVRLSSRNIVNNAYHVGQGLGYSPSDRLCLCVPLFHCFGCVIGVLASYTHGVTIHLVEVFEPVRVLQAVSEHQCTSLYGVPTMFLAQLEHPELPRFRLDSLRTGVMAGSLCPEPLMRRVMSEMGLHELTIAYGLTEASPVITQTPRHDSIQRRTQTVGRVLPELEVRVVRPESQEDAATGEPGELWVRGENVMLGYHDNEAATEAAITPDGWLRTGDQATMDEEGYVRITGRLKDVIIRGGENIGPAEVEDALRLHPAVLDAAVYGVPCSKFGEEVAAAIRVRPGQSLCLEDLQGFCRSRLARFKVPRHIRLVDEFPLTASGKIQKYRLRETHL